MQFRGHVVYSDGKNVGTPASRIDREFVEQLGSLITRLAPDAPARRVPSAAECRFCDITKQDCPARVEVNYTPEGATDDF